MADITAVIEALVEGNQDKLIETVQKAIDGGGSASVILNEGLITGMDIVGAKMETGEMFIPEVLMSAKAMAAAVEILKPLLGDEPLNVSGKVVFGTVKGDLHDIGKNLVKMMLESSGFDVIDAGVDVDPEKFVALIKEHKPNLVGLSALLTTTMGKMKNTIDAIEEAGLRDSVKIIIGGAPVNQEFADEIGADGYAPDAGSASRLAKAMLV